MSDLGEMLGALVVSLAKARQIADAESAVMAEWYRSQPLLEGTTIPRLRFLEVVLDIPLLLKPGEGAEPNELAEPKAIAEAAGAELRASASRAGIELSADVVDAAVSAIASGVAELKDRPASSGARSLSREAVARIGEAEVTRVVSASPVAAKLAGDRLRTVVSDVRRRIEAIAELRPGRPPSIGATLVTSEVKDKADPNTVTRIRLTLREEGLEWTTGSARDGTQPRRLSPE